MGAPGHDLLGSGGDALRGAGRSHGGAAPVSRLDRLVETTLSHFRPIVAGLNTNKPACFKQDKRKSPSGKSFYEGFQTGFALP
jgi:hypothetical protein